MPKQPTFLLCENPMADDVYGHRLFILHSKEPLVFAQVLHYDIGERDMAMRDLSESSSSLTYEDEFITFHVIWLVPGEATNNLSAEESAKKLAKIMRRMADWYHAYLKYEDDQIADQMDEE